MEVEVLLMLKVFGGIVQFFVTRVVWLEDGNQK
jgi:hypothetical protein